MATTAAVPLARRGVTRPQLGAAVLAAATVILVLRLPGSVILMAIAPIISLYITRLHRPPSPARWLWAFLGCAVLSSMAAVFIAPSGLSPVNFFTLSLTFTLFAVAILGSGNSKVVAGIIMRALYWSFGLALIVGLGEMATGFKMQTVLYPEASNLTFAGRFVVAAWFPNYNDFAVVITMFALIALTRFLFSPSASMLRQLLRLCGYVLASASIVIGGSRGALLGLIVGTFLICVHTIRVLRPKLISAPVIVMGGLAAGAAAVLLWSTPWVQDNSTTVRGRILTDTLELMPATDPTFWFGWGDIGRFTRATDLAYTGVLMDPHNVLLEVFVWFGLPTLLLLMALWLFVCWIGMWRMDVAPDWRATAAVMLFALFPVLGIVPSSSLRYYHLFLIAPCAIAFLRPRSMRGETTWQSD